MTITMMNQSDIFNQQSSKVFNTSLILSIVAIAWFTLLFDFFVIIRLTCCDRSKYETVSSVSRRIGLLHSKTTYIHLIGNTLTFLFIALRSPTRDRLWFCHIANYCFALFTAGIYGSSFCQSLFRYWRITRPNPSLFRQYSFHRYLCITHWIFLFCISTPMGLRSMWISDQETCFDDLWSIMYISFVCVIPPVIGNLVIYIKVIVFLHENCRNKIRAKNSQRNASIIRRILILLLTLLITSIGMMIIWPLVVTDGRFLRLSHRFIALTVEIDMFICSIIFVVVSPQLRKILKRKSSPMMTNEIRSSITSNAPPFRERNHAESISFETEFNLGL